MNYGPLIFLGIFFTLASSWFGLVMMPYLTLGNLQAVTLKETGQQYPSEGTGDARRGLDVYRANGCVYCHSQQVRAEDFGVDIQRGWGSRRSVPLDYINQKPVLLGTMRTGPDLTNIGARQPSADWHYTHFYNPRILIKESNMPAYPFLFRVQKIGSQPSTNALKLPKEFAPRPGYEVVPTDQARNLVAYMLSLKTTTTLPE